MLIPFVIDSLRELRPLLKLYQKEQLQKIMNYTSQTTQVWDTVLEVEIVEETKKFVNESKS